MAKKQKKQPSKVQTALRDAVKQKVSPLEAVPLTPPVPELGIRCGEKFEPVSGVIFIAVSSEFSSRLATGDAGQDDAVMEFVRLVFLRRIDNDFGTTLTVRLLADHLAVTLPAMVDWPILFNRCFLQERLDEACERVAKAMGV